MIIFDTIAESLISLRAKFTLRAFLFLLLGFILLLANIFIFFASALYAFKNYSFLSTFFLFLFGLLGFVLSCFLIFYISIYVAANRPEERKFSGSSGSLLSSARAHKGKGRGKKIAAAIIIYAAIWLVGIGAIGYYFFDRAKYNNYVETPAEIISLKGDSEDGYTCRFKYVIDGQTYEADGHLKADGMAAPKTGDRTIIKYNPKNPNDIYLQSEKLFLLGFGSFFIYVGILLILYEFVNSGYLSLQLFLAYILLGLTAVIMNMTLIMVPGGFIQYFAKNFWIHFILVFGNVGTLMLFEGIIDFKIPKKHLDKAKK